VRTGNKHDDPSPCTPENANTECEKCDKEKNNCECKSIECKEPDLEKSSGVIPPLTMTPNPPIEPRIYNSEITLTCDKGYSFFGQKFKCPEEPQICSASYVCREKGRFERTTYCPTDGGEGHIWERKEGNIVSLIDIPSTCEKIPDFCPALPSSPVSKGLALDGEGFSISSNCMNPSGGGALKESCSFDCSQVEKAVDDIPRKCLKNTEDLVCEDDGKWKFQSTSEALSVAEDAGIQKEMEKKCWKAENMRTCPDPDEETEVRNSLVGARFTGKKSKNGWRKRGLKVDHMCGTRLQYKCVVGNFPDLDGIVDGQPSSITFECISEGEGAMWRLVRTDETELATGPGPTLFDRTWECIEPQPKLCEGGDPTWYTGIWKDLFYFKPKKGMTTDKYEEAMLRCKIDWVSSADDSLADEYEHKKSNTCEPNWRQPSVTVKCKDGSFPEPPVSDIDLCAYQIKFQNKALSVKDGALKLEEPLPTDASQRWVFSDGNKRKFPGQIISVAGLKRNELEVTATCIGMPDSDSCASCWKKCEEELITSKACDPKCEDKCEVTVGDCPAAANARTPEGDRYAWTLTQDTVSKKCAFSSRSMQTQADGLEFWLNEEEEEENSVSWFLQDKGGKMILKGAALQRFVGMKGGGAPTHKDAEQTLQEMKFDTAPN